LTFRHSYASLGDYNVRLTVANAVGKEEVLRQVSVVRPLQRASMTVTMVRLLGQPTTFSFKVDETLTPAMPITVRLEYDDGEEETVFLGSIRREFSVVTHTHTYAKFVGDFKCFCSLSYSAFMHPYYVTILTMLQSYLAVYNV